MGVRFACHACGKRLNIKQDLAGKRGVCPGCQVRFRIPEQDSPKSQPVSASPSGSGIRPVPQRQPSERNHPNASPTIPAAPGTEMPAQTGGPELAPSPREDASGATSLAMLDGDDEATWYVRPPTGGQYGPAGTDMLRQWIDQGRVASTSLLWRDGWPQWRSASEALPEFADALAAAEAPPTSEVATPGLGAAAPASSDPVSGADTTGAALTGDATLGTRRGRIQSRRYGMIAGLAAVTIGLVGVLVYLVVR